MANTIKLKRGSGSNPGTSDLSVGEVALRTDNGTLFTKNDAGNITEIGASSGVADGDKGDITVASSGTSWTIDANAVTRTKINDEAITTAKLRDNAVTNDKISSSAAIAGTKISPDFGSQNVVTTGTLDTGNATLNNANITQRTDGSTDNGVFINSGDTGAGNRPNLVLKGAGSAALSQEAIQVYYNNGSNKTFDLDFEGNIEARDLDVRHADFSAGIDVTGNITVSGTVDGVDIAARNTLFGGLTSSSGVLSNGVTATTQSASDNSTKIATTAYTDTAISNLVDSSPSALNTLNELAAALGDDANFSTTVTNSIATKLPLAGGTLTGALTVNAEINARRLTLSDDGATSPTLMIKTDDNSPWGFIIKNDTYSTDVNVGFKAYQGNDGHLNLQQRGNSEYNQIFFTQYNGTTSRSLLTFNTSGNATFGGSVTATGGFSGSGASLTNVNATTLDSIDSGSFLRSDANDTSSGTIAFGTGSLDPDSFASYSGGFGAISDTSWGARGVFVHGGGTGDAAAMAHNGSKLYFGIQNGSSANSMTTWLDVTPSTRVINFQTANNATNVQIGGNKIFHAGNDGGGSGLDADTLDGVQGASFLRSDATDSFSGNTLNFDGSDDGKIILSGTSNPYIRFRESTTNKAYLQWSSSGYINIANQESGETLRIKDGASGLKWIVGSTEHTVWNANNDGAGSGLDADELDGIAGSGYLRSNTNDTFTGSTLVFDSSTDQKIILEGSNSPYIRWKEGSTNKAYIQWNTSGYLYLRNQEDSSVLILRDNLNFSQDAINFKKIWNEYNDGSGSGLDADTLDGVEGSNFLRSNTSDNCSGTITFDAEKGIRCSHGQQTDGNDGFIASGKFGTGLNIVGTQTSSGTGRQIRLWGNLITSGGDTYWASGNDGAGSGLDADTLDGLHASQIGGFPSGTRMVFQQTSAPSGWTKDTSDTNQRALRVVSGTAGSGGSVDFTTAFASNRGSSSNNGGNTGNRSATTGGRSLSEAQLNQHRHKVDTHNEWSGDYGHHTTQSWRQVHTGGTGYLPWTSWTGSSSSHNHGGGSHNHSTPNHSHTTNVAVRYLDVIIASKD